MSLFTLLCLQDETRTCLHITRLCKQLDQKTKDITRLNFVCNFFQGLSLLVILVVASSICIFTLAGGLAYLHR